ncbi:MAG: hypothetical protein ACREFR_11000 [Limisphaerales bacterium]
MAVFSLLMASDCNDIEGSLERFGQQTAIAVPRYDENISGTFRFDRKRGCLVSMSTSGRLHFDLNMVVSGNSVESHSDTEIRTSFDLLSQ